LKAYLGLIYISRHSYFVFVEKKHIERRNKKLPEHCKYAKRPIPHSSIKGMILLKSLSLGNSPSFRTAN